MGSERAQETVRRLQADITAGRWPVNSRIPTEAELAAELGVGRSTVREAVRSLAHLGMLEPAPGRGTFVRSLNPVHGVLADFAAGHPWRDILAVRRALEREAAGLAAEHRSDEGLALLRAAYEADLEGRGGTERGRSPGQFHVVLFEMAQNRLLAALYGGLLATLQDGITAGDVHSALTDAQRQRDHAALLAAVEAGDAAAAAEVATRHSETDLVADAG
jgi:DNA-binding FadR family transcriptional regulator